MKCPVCENQTYEIRNSDARWCYHCGTLSRPEAGTQLLTMLALEYAIKKEKPDFRKLEVK